MNFYREVGWQELDCHRPWTNGTPAEEQSPGQREPRTNPQRKRAWRRALRLLIIAGACHYRGKRYAVDDGSATMLAHPETLSTLRASLSRPRPAPSWSASSARAPSASRGTMLCCNSFLCETICRMNQLPELGRWAQGANLTFARAGLWNRAVW